MRFTVGERSRLGCTGRRLADRKGVKQLGVELITEGASMCSARAPNTTREDACAPHTFPTHTSPEGTGGSPVLPLDP